MKRYAFIPKWTGMIVMMVVFLALQGCGGLMHNNTRTVTVRQPDGTVTTTSYDYTNDAVFYDSAARYGQAEAARAANAVDKIIANSQCTNCDPATQAISRALGGVIAGQIRPTPWTLTRGTSWADVAKDGINGIALPLGIVTVGAVRMSDRTAPQTVINGKKNTFTKSFNKSENHATGQGNTSTFTPPEVTIVDPAYPPSPASTSPTADAAQPTPAP